MEERVKRSFEEEFSLNWTCKLEMHPYLFTNCVDRKCYNGAKCTEDREEKGGIIIPTGRCSCPSGWLGRECDQCCDLPCNNGTCEIHHVHDLQFCNCFGSNRTGAQCTEPLPTDKPFTVHHSTVEWEIPVIVSSTLIVVLAILIFATLFAMYRSRHPWIVKYLVRYHERNIDDSNKRYDTFISYRTSDDADRHYVLRKLLPFLENSGYTVCIDQRDFIVGGAIVDTIMEAIQCSKRTILVLSPAFVQGKWPEFEAQRALLESVHNQHRIIPIILKPINSDEIHLSPTLRHILESITYIEWPSEESKEKEFWNRLVVALPKTLVKDEVSVDSDVQQSIESQSSQCGLLRSKKKKLQKSNNLFSKKQIQNYFAASTLREDEPIKRTPTMEKIAECRQEEDEINRYSMAILQGITPPKTDTQDKEGTLISAEDSQKHGNDGLIIDDERPGNNTKIPDAVAIEIYV